MYLFSLPLRSPVDLLSLPVLHGYIREPGCMHGSLTIPFSILVSYSLSAFGLDT